MNESELVTRTATRMVNKWGGEWGVRGSEWGGVGREWWVREWVSGGVRGSEWGSSEWGSEREWVGREWWVREGASGEWESERWVGNESEWGCVWWVGEGVVSGEWEGMSGKGVVSEGGSEWWVGEWEVSGERAESKSEWGSVWWVVSEEGSGEWGVRGSEWGEVVGGKGESWGEWVGGCEWWVGKGVIGLQSTHSDWLWRLSQLAVSDNTPIIAINSLESHSLPIFVTIRGHPLGKWYFSRQSRTLHTRYLVSFGLSDVHCTKWWYCHRLDKLISYGLLKAVRLTTALLLRVWSQFADTVRVQFRKK